MTKLLVHVIVFVGIFCKGLESEKKYDYLNTSGCEQIGYWKKFLCLVLLTMLLLDCCLSCCSVLLVFSSILYLFVFFYFMY